jgi:S-adenosylmethionine:diacylglycerol 3-amino-3-carboxypropyl transferase
MQYNFEVRTALTDEENNQIVSEVAEGLEATSQVIMRVNVRVNTELPDDKVELLRQAVDGLVSEKLGTDAEVTLLSQEP